MKNFKQFLLVVILLSVSCFSKAQTNSVTIPVSEYNNYKTSHLDIVASSLPTYTTIGYQWQFEISGVWNNISGATLDTFNLYGQTAGDYRLMVIINGSTYIYSNVAYVSVCSCPINITPSVPAKTYITTGGTLKEIGTNVYGSTTYQWQESTDEITWTNISGATTDSLNSYLYLTTPGQRIKFRLQYVIVGITMTSNEVWVSYSYFILINGLTSTLCKNPALSISINTDNIGLPSGSSTTGTWQESTNGGSIWTSLNANVSPFDIQPYITGTQSIAFRYTETNTQLGTYNSNVVWAQECITVSPQQVCPGSTINLIDNFVLSGGYNPFIQIIYVQKDRANQPWTELSYNQFEQNMTSFHLDTLYNFKVVIQSGDGQIDTIITQANLNGDFPVKIGPTQTLCYTQQPQLITAIGTDFDHPSKWWTSTDSSNFTLFATTTGDSIMLTKPSSGKLYVYRENNINSSICPNGTNSDTISITSITKLNPGAIGSNQTLCYDVQPAEINNLTLPTGNIGSYTYQWQQSFDSASWTNISGATSSSYQPGALTKTTYYLRNASTGVCDNENSNVIKIAVYPNLIGGIIGNSQGICYDATPNNITLLNSFTGGTGSYTYQWQQSSNKSSWTNIIGQFNTSFQPSSLTSTTYYQLAGTSGTCGTVNSNIDSVTVSENLVGGTIGNSQTICYNSTPNALITITNGTTGTYTYQWQQSQTGTAGTFQNIVGATGQSYQPGNLTSTTYYQREKISQSCGTALSNVIEITVLNNLIAGQIGTNQTLCYNTTPDGLVSLALPTGGTGSYTYQWQQSTNDFTWTNIAGATSLQYAPPQLEVTTYYQRVETSGTCGSVTSNSVTVTVLNPITSGVIGNNQTICYNTVPALISEKVSATGGTGSYTYQWQQSFDSINWSNITISGTNSTYQPVALTQNVWFQRIVTSGSCGEIISNKVKITVNSPVVSGEIGVNQNICYNTAPNQINNITLPTGGSGSFIYQWQQSPDGQSWSNILINGSEVNYQPENLSATTYFRRSEINICQTTYSNTVVIYVYANLQAGQIGSSQTICYATQPSGLISLALPTGGTNSYSYQWQQSIDNFTWTNIAGATSLQYAPPQLEATTYYQRVETSGTCGSVNSNELTLTVLGQVTSGIIGNNQTICYNTIPSQITEKVSATGGTGSYTYQWQQSLDSINWSNIAINGTSVSYQPLALTQNVWYQRVVTSGSCGEIISNKVKITVNSPVVSGEIGVNQNVCYNTAPNQINNITLPTGGSGSFTYQWQQSPDGQSWSNILINGSGENYQPENLSATTYFRRSEINICQTTYSNTVVIYVYANLQAGQIGSSQTICYATQPSGLISLALPTGGTNSYSYQWQQSIDNFTWTNIAGATSTQYMPSALENTTYYKRVETSGGCGSVTCNVVTITVLNQLTCGSIGSNQTICYNTIPSLLTETVSATGGTDTYTYQWQLSYDSINWSNIAGNATGITYQPPTVTQNVWYRRVVTSGTCNNVASNKIKISIISGITAGEIGSNQNICYNIQPSQINNISLPSGGSGTFTYQWQQSTDGINWTNIIVNANTINYQPGNLTTTTFFRRNEINSCAYTNSNTVTIYVYGNLVAGSIGNNQYLCQNALPSQIFQINTPIGGSGNYTYQWQQSPDGYSWTNIVGATSNDYQPLANNKTTYYRIQESDADCGTVYTNTVEIQFYSPIASGLIGPSQTTIFNTMPSIIDGQNASGGNGVYVYQWQQSLDSLTWSDVTNNGNGVSYQPYILTQTTFYRRIVNFNSCGTDTSNVVKIEVLSNLSAGTINSNQNICYNATPQLLTGSQASGGSGNYSYQWQQSIDDLNWKNVSFAGQSLNYQPGQLDSSLYFRRMLTDLQAGSVASNSIFIYVNAKVPAPVTDMKNVYCQGTNIVITITDTIDGTVYTWNNDNVLTTGNKFITSNVLQSFSILVYANIGTCFSSQVNLNINVDSIKAGFYASQTTCKVGEAISFTNTSVNGNSYVWNFYDGDESYETNPFHYYYTEGEKNVKLVATSVNGCNDSIVKVNYINVTPATAVNTASEQAFMVYPNPVTTDLHVNMGNDSYETDIILMNISGQLLQEVKGYENIQISFEGYPAGIYLLKIKSGSTEQIVKIVKID